MVSGPVRCSFALRPAGSLTRRPGLLHQGLRAFHCFKARLGCYRLERKLPGGFALPLEFCAFPRRTQTRSKLDFSRSARHEKEQIDETKTQAVQWCLQGASWLGGLNGSENDGANRAREPGAPASGGSMEKDRSGAVARSL